MKNKIFFAIIFILICSVLSYANELKSSSVSLENKYKNDFRLDNSIVRFSAGSSYGKVASDREAMNNNSFRIFKTFRNAAIGMFVPGSLFFMGSIIPLSILTAIILTEADAIGGNAAAVAAAFSKAATFSLGGFYTCLAILALSGIFLVCGIAFAIVAGVYHYKWTEERDIVSYSYQGNDKPQFAQSIRIAL